MHKMPTKFQIADEQWRRYSYSRDNGHLDYIKKADMCDEYFAGLQWNPIVRAKLESQGKPVLTINKVLATLATVMGEQLRARADISFRPVNKGTQEVADALTKVYIQITNQNKLDWLESEVSSDGFITSRGYYDIRIDFDQQMLGEVSIKRLNPRNVVLDADASEYDPDTWKEVFITKWLTANDIELLYGKKYADILKTKTAGDFQYGFDSAERFHGTFAGTANTPEYDLDDDSTRRKIRVVERQYRKLRNQWHFVDMVTGDTRAVPENWDEAKRTTVASTASLGLVKKLTEHIRWTVTADDQVLFDDWSPYKYYTIVPYFPFLRNGRTIGLVENLLSPQDQLNKVSSQELHIINTTANSGWKLKAGSLQNMDAEDLEERGAETGLVLELADINDVEKINPNQVPTGLDRVSFKSDEYIKEISGISDSQRGMDRADVAAKAIQAKQAAGSVNLAKPLDNITRTRHLLAMRVLSLIQTYYTEERILQITGRDLTAKTEQIAINKVTPEGQIINDLTIGEYDIIVSNVPAREDFESTQFQEALELRKLGIAIPDDILIEASHLSRKVEIAERIKKLQGGGEATEAQQQLQQLEMQSKQLENQEKQADIQVKSSSAALNAVRARKEMQAAQQGDNSELELEQQKVVAELQLQKAKQDGELELEREKLEAELVLKQQEQQASQHLAIQNAEAQNKQRLLDSAVKATQVPKPTEK